MVGSGKLEIGLEKDMDIGGREREMERERWRWRWLEAYEPPTQSDQSGLIDR